MDKPAFSVLPDILRIIVPSLPLPNLVVPNLLMLGFPGLAQCVLGETARTFCIPNNFRKLSDM